MCMGEVPDASMPESMYSNATEEELCIRADSNGISIELVDREVRRYWLYPGVTGWSQEKLREWVEDVLDGKDYGICSLQDGPVEVEVYE